MKHITFDETSKHVAKMQNITDSLMRRRRYSSALFWCDKLISINIDSMVDCLRYVECLFNMQDYSRACDFIISRKLESKSPQFQLLCAQCYFEIKLYIEATTVLNIANTGNLISRSVNSNDTDITMDEISSEIALLKGRIAETQQDREKAVQFYQCAIKMDVGCHEAVERLVTLLDSASLEGHLDYFSGDLMESIYQLLYFKHPKDRPQIGSIAHSICENSVDGMICNVERLFDQFMFNEAYILSKKVLERDSLNEKHIPFHIGLLYKLNKETELYNFTNVLISCKPKTEISIYSMGVYYLLRRKIEMARKHFRRVTNMNINFVYAWITLGHTYSIDCEHDQAISAYLSAANVSKRNKRPLVSVATEYFSLDNLALSFNLLKEALLYCPEDPVAIFELAVIDFKREKFTTAIDGFNLTKTICQSRGIDLMDQFWEPLFNNLGFCHRKLGSFDLAIENHRISLNIRKSSTAYSAISLNYCYQNKFFEAIELLHKGLSVSRDDVFAHRLLVYCIDMYDKIPILLVGGLNLKMSTFVEPLSPGLIKMVDNNRPASTDDIDLTVRSVEFSESP